MTNSVNTQACCLVCAMHLLSPTYSLHHHARALCPLVKQNTTQKLFYYHCYNGLCGKKDIEDVCV